MLKALSIEFQTLEMVCGAQALTLVLWLPHSPTSELRPASSSLLDLLPAPAAMTKRQRQQLINRFTRVPGFPITVLEALKPQIINVARDSVSVGPASVSHKAPGSVLTWKRTKPCSGPLLGGKKKSTHKASPSLMMALPEGAIF